MSEYRKKHIVKIREQGRAAFKLGLPVNHNPYRGADSVQWAEAWNAARHEDLAIQRHLEESHTDLAHRYLWLRNHAAVAIDWSKIPNAAKLEAGMGAGDRLDATIDAQLPVRAV